MAEGESLRFPALQKSVNQFIEEQKNKQTLPKTRQDVSWLAVRVSEIQTRKSAWNIEEIQPEELNDFLSEFIVTVKRKDGGDYEPSSLRGLIASFNRQLKNVKYSKSIVEDQEVWANKESAGCSLQTPKKKEGRSNRPFAAEAISDDEVSVLYESNILGISSTEALINTVWLMNSIHFGLRGCDEHRQMSQMCWSDVRLLRDADRLNI